MTFCRWKSPRPIRCATRCHSAFRAVQAAASSRRWRAARTASCRRSHQYPPCGAGEVDPGEQVRGPAERPPRDSGGDPAAHGRGDEGSLCREQPRMRGGALIAMPCQPARRGGGHRGVGDDMARHVGGVQDPGGRPGEQDDGQRQPLGRGVQVPGPQPGPRRLSEPGPARPAGALESGRAWGTGFPSSRHRHFRGKARARRGSPGRGHCRVLP